MCPNEPHCVSIWWDEDLNLARIIERGHIDENAAWRVLQETYWMAWRHGKHIDWLADLREVAGMSEEARTVLAEAMTHWSIRRYAFIKGNKNFRTMDQFPKAGPQNKTKVFSSEEKAIQWLMKGRDNLEQGKVYRISHATEITHASRSQDSDCGR